MKASTKKIKKGKATASTRQFDNFNNTQNKKRLTAEPPGDLNSRTTK